MNARGEYGPSRRTWTGADPIPPLPAAFKRGVPEKKPWEPMLIGGLVVAGAGLGLYWLKNLSASVK